MNKKRRWLAALAPLAVLPMVLGSGAGAAPAWETFGSGSAVGRGHWLDGMYPTYADANLEVVSVTKRRPDKVRLVIDDGLRAAKSFVELSLHCFLSNVYWDRTIDFIETDLPRTFTWDPPSHFHGRPLDNCQLEVEVSPSFLEAQSGPLTVTMQATY